MQVSVFPAVGIEHRGDQLSHPKPLGKNDYFPAGIFQNFSKLDFQLTDLFAFDCPLIHQIRIVAHHAHHLKRPQEALPVLFT